MQCVLISLFIYLLNLVFLQAEKMWTLINAANVKIDSYWPGLFAKLFQKKNIEDLIFNVGSGKRCFQESCLLLLFVFCRIVLYK